MDKIKRIISIILVVSFIGYDLSWAYPDALGNREAKSDNNLAPSSFFARDGSIDRFYAKAISGLLDVIESRHGIPQERISLAALEAALKRVLYNSKDREWLENNIGYAESEGELSVSFRHLGYTLRYYDPSVAPREKYGAQEIADVPVNGRLRQQVLKTQALPAAGTTLTHGRWVYSIEELRNIYRRCSNGYRIAGLRVFAKEKGDTRYRSDYEKILRSLLVLSPEERRAFVGWSRSRVNLIFFRRAYGLLSRDMEGVEKEELRRASPEEAKRIMRIFAAPEAEGCFYVYRTNGEVAGYAAYKMEPSGAGARITDMGVNEALRYGAGGPVLYCLQGVLSDEAATTGVGRISASIMRDHPQCVEIEKALIQGGFELRNATPEEFVYERSLSPSVHPARKGPARVAERRPEPTGAEEAVEGFLDENKGDAFTVYEIAERLSMDMSHVMRAAGHLAILGSIRTIFPEAQSRFNEWAHAASSDYSEGGSEYHRFMGIEEERFTVPIAHFKPDLYTPRGIDEGQCISVSGRAYLLIRQLTPRALLVMELDRFSREVLKLDPEPMELEFLEYARHENIVEFNAILIDENGKPAASTRYHGARTLRNYVETRRGQPLSGYISEALGIAAGVGKAFQYLHDQGYQYGDDFIPEQVVISDGSGEPVLLDFGGIRRYENPDEDIKNISNLLSYLFAGRFYRHPDSACDIDPKTINPDVPDEISRIARKASGAIPGEAYESVAAMVQDIRDFRDSLPDTGLRRASSSGSESAGIDGEPARVKSPWRTNPILAALKNSAVAASAGFAWRAVEAMDACDAGFPNLIPLMRSSVKWFIIGFLAALIINKARLPSRRAPNGNEETSLLLGAFGIGSIIFYFLGFLGFPCSGLFGFMARKWLVGVSSFSAASLTLALWEEDNISREKTPRRAVTEENAAGSGEEEEESGHPPADGLRRSSSGDVLNILVVCQEDLERSPMVAGYLNEMFPWYLEGKVIVRSAGVNARGGEMPLSAEACGEAGIYIGDHRSTPLTGDLVDEADVIWAVSEAERIEIERAFPQARDKTSLLFPDRDMFTHAAAGMRSQDMFYRAWLRDLSSHHPELMNRVAYCHWQKFGDAVLQDAAADYENWRRKRKGPTLRDKEMALLRIYRKYDLDRIPEAVWLQLCRRTILREERPEIAEAAQNLESNIRLMGTARKSVFLGYTAPHDVIMLAEESGLEEYPAYRNTLLKALIPPMYKKDFEGFSDYMNLYDVILDNPDEEKVQRRLGENMALYKAKAIDVTVKEDMVPLSVLRPSQEEVDPRVLELRLFEERNGWQLPIMVLRPGPRARAYYIQDGHNRVVAALLMGAYEIKAYVFETYLPVETRYEDLMKTLGVRRPEDLKPPVAALTAERFVEYWLRLEGINRLCRKLRIEADSGAMAALSDEGLLDTIKVFSIEGGFELQLDILFWPEWFRLFRSVIPEEDALGVILTHCIDKGILSVSDEKGNVTGVLEPADVPERFSPANFTGFCEDAGVKLGDVEREELRERFFHLLGMLGMLPPGGAEGATSGFRASSSGGMKKSALPHDYTGSLVVIGGSSGGYEIICEIIERLPYDHPPVIVCEHISPPVLPENRFRKLVNDPDRNIICADKPCDFYLKRGTVLVARNVAVARDADGYPVARVDYGIAPVNKLFKSAAESFGDRIIGVVVSGVGNDGSEGALEVSAKGGRVFVQEGGLPGDVSHPGMPESVVNLGVPCKAYPAAELAQAIMAACAGIDAAGRAGGEDKNPRPVSDKERIRSIRHDLRNAFTSLIICLEMVYENKAASGEAKTLCVEIKESISKFTKFFEDFDESAETVSEDLNILDGQVMNLMALLSEENLGLLSRELSGIEDVVRIFRDNCERARLVLASEFDLPLERRGQYGINRLLDIAVNMELESCASIITVKRRGAAPDDTRLSANEGDVFRILANIFRNAREVVISNEGEKLISVEVDLRHDALMVRIADNGPDMSEDKMLAFNKGMHVASSKAHMDNLGLDTIRRLMAKSRGTVRVEKRSGEGAVFIVELPLAGDDPDKKEGGTPKDKTLPMIRESSSGKAQTRLHINKPLSVEDFLGIMEDPRVKWNFKRARQRLSAYADARQLPLFARTFGLERAVKEKIWFLLKENGFDLSVTAPILGVTSSALSLWIRYFGLEAKVTRSRKAFNAKGLVPVKEPLTISGFRKIMKECRWNVSKARGVLSRYARSNDFMAFLRTFGLQEEFEKAVIRVFEENGFNLENSCAAMGVSEHTMGRWLKELNIEGTIDKMRRESRKTAIPAERRIARKKFKDIMDECLWNVKTAKEVIASAGYGRAGRFLWFITRRNLGVVVADWMRDELFANGYDEDALAKKMNMSVRTVVNWEIALGIRARVVAARKALRVPLARPAAKKIKKKNPAVKKTKAKAAPRKRVPPKKAKRPERLSERRLKAILDKYNWRVEAAREELKPWWKAGVTFIKFVEDRGMVRVVGKKVLGLIVANGFNLELTADMLGITVRALEGWLPRLEIEEEAARPAAETEVKEIESPEPEVEQKPPAVIEVIPEPEIDPEPEPGPESVIEEETPEVSTLAVSAPAVPDEPGPVAPKITKLDRKKAELQRAKLLFSEAIRGLSALRRDIEIHRHPEYMLPKLSQAVYGVSAFRAETGKAIPEAWLNTLKASVVYVRNGLEDDPLEPPEGWREDIRDITDRITELEDGPAGRASSTGDRITVFGKEYKINRAVFDAIRAARPDDARAIRRLLYLIDGPDTPSNITEAHIRRLIEESIDPSPDGGYRYYIRVHERDGKVQAYTFATIHLKEGSVTINETAVAAHLQRQGIGTALRARLLKDMEEIGYHRFSVQPINADSAGLAATFGFRVVSERNPVWTADFSSYASSRDQADRNSDESRDGVAEVRSSSAGTEESMQNAVYVVEAGAEKFVGAYPGGMKMAILERYPDCIVRNVRAEGRGQLFHGGFKWWGERKEYTASQGEAPMGGFILEYREKKPYMAWNPHGEMVKGTHASASERNAVYIHRNGEEVFVGAFPTSFGRKQREEHPDCIVRNVQLNKMGGLCHGGTHWWPRKKRYSVKKNEEPLSGFVLEYKDGRPYKAWDDKGNLAYDVSNAESQRNAVYQIDEDSEEVFVGAFPDNFARALEEHPDCIVRNVQLDRGGGLNLDVRWWDRNKAYAVSEDEEPFKGFRCEFRAGKPYRAWDPEDDLVYDLSAPLDIRNAMYVVEDEVEVFIGAFPFEITKKLLQQYPDCMVRNVQVDRMGQLNNGGFHWWKARKRYAVKKDEEPLSGFVLRYKDGQPYKAWDPDGALVYDASATEAARNAVYIMKKGKEVLVEAFPNRFGTFELEKYPDCIVRNVRLQRDGSLYHGAQYWWESRKAFSAPEGSEALDGFTLQYKKKSPYRAWDQNGLLVYDASLEESRRDAVYVRDGKRLVFIRAYPRGGFGRLTLEVYPDCVVKNVSVAEDGHLVHGGFKWWGPKEGYAVNEGEECTSGFRLEYRNGRPYRAWDAKNRIVYDIERLKSERNAVYIVEDDEEVFMGAFPGKFAWAQLRRFPDCVVRNVEVARSGSLQQAGYRWWSDRQEYSVGREEEPLSRFTLEYKGGTPYRAWDPDDNPVSLREELREMITPTGRIERALREFPGGFITKTKLSELSGLSFYTLDEYDWRDKIEKENRQRRDAGLPEITIYNRNAEEVRPLRSAFVILQAMLAQGLKIEPILRGVLNKEEKAELRGHLLTGEEEGLKIGEVCFEVAILLLRIVETPHSNALLIEARDRIEALLPAFTELSRGIFRSLLNGDTVRHIASNLGPRCVNISKHKGKVIRGLAGAEEWLAARRKKVERDDTQTLTLPEYRQIALLLALMTEGAREYIMTAAGLDKEERRAVREAAEFDMANIGKLYNSNSKAVIYKIMRDAALKEEIKTFLASLKKGMSSLSGDKLMEPMLYYLGWHEGYEGIACFQKQIGVFMGYSQMQISRLLRNSLRRLKGRIVLDLVETVADDGSASFSLRSNVETLAERWEPSSRRLKRLLARARLGNYCVPAFPALFKGIPPELVISAIIEAAKAEHNPVIILCHSEGLEEAGLDPTQFKTLVKKVERRLRADIPVFVGLNHGNISRREDDTAFLREAVNAGFDYITAHRPSDNPKHLEQDIREVRRIVEIAHSNDVLVEGVFVETGEASRPDEAQRFVVSTGIDFMAISSGTLHEKIANMLRFRLAREIDKRIGIPLAIYEGSSIPETDFKRVRSRFSKVNIGRVIYEAAQSAYELHGSDAHEKAREAIRECVRAKMRALAPPDGWQPKHLYLIGSPDKTAEARASSSGGESVKTHYRVFTGDLAKYIRMSPRRLKKLIEEAYPEGLTAAQEEELRRFNDDVFPALKRLRAYHDREFERPVGCALVTAVAAIICKDKGFRALIGRNQGAGEYHFCVALNICGIRFLMDILGEYAEYRAAGGRDTKDYPNCGIAMIPIDIPKDLVFREALSVYRNMELGGFEVANAAPGTKYALEVMVRPIGKNASYIHLDKDLEWFIVSALPGFSAQRASSAGASKTGLQGSSDADTMALQEELDAAVNELRQEIIGLLPKEPREPAPGEIPVYMPFSDSELIYSGLKGDRKYWLPNWHAGHLIHLANLLFTGLELYDPAATASHLKFNGEPEDFDNIIKILKSKNTNPASGFDLEEFRDKLAKLCALYYYLTYYLPHAEEIRTGEITKSTNYKLLLPETQSADFNPPPDKPCLNIGCGLTGLDLASKWPAENAPLILVDINPFIAGMVGEYARLVGKPNIRVLLADASDPGFLKDMEEGSIGSVQMDCVLQYAESSSKRRSILAMARRMLMPEGRLVINDTTITGIKDSSLSPTEFPSALRQEAQDAGFEIEEYDAERLTHSLFLGGEVEDYRVRIVARPLNTTAEGAGTPASSGGEIDVESGRRESSSGKRVPRNQKEGKMSEITLTDDYAVEAALKEGFPFNEYVNMALYDPDFGYYTTGRVRLGHDFGTFAIALSPAYGAMVAEHLHRMWKSMVEAGDMDEEERFYVIEPGAGTGILARDIIRHMEERAREDDDWRRFYGRVHYTICEISPELVKEQRKTTDEFAGRIEVKNVDALNITEAFERPVKGAIISDELIDAMESYILRFKQSGDIEACVAVMALNGDKVASMVPDGERVNLFVLLEREGIVQKGIFEASDRRLRAALGVKHDRGILLGRQEFLAVKKALAKPGREALAEMFNFCIEGVPVYVPLRSLRDRKINDYVSSHIDEIARRVACAEKDIEINLMPDNDRFARAASNVLAKGFVLTMDLGGPAGEEGAMSTYGIGYDQPYFLGYTGEIDICVSPIFAMYARAGDEAGLEPVFFGKKRSLEDGVPVKITTGASDGAIRRAFLRNAVMMNLEDHILDRSSVPADIREQMRDVARQLLDGVPARNLPGWMDLFNAPGAVRVSTEMRIILEISSLIQDIGQHALEMVPVWKERFEKGHVLLLQKTRSTRSAYSFPDNNRLPLYTELPGKGEEVESEIRVVKGRILASLGDGSDAEGTGIRESSSGKQDEGTPSRWAEGLTPDAMRDCPQEVVKIHRQVGDEVVKVPEGYRIVLSEGLFNPEDVVALNCVFNKDVVGIRPPEAIRAMSTNGNCAKLACVVTREEFTRLWKDSHRNANGARMIVLEDDLKGENYLYLEGLLKFASAILKKEREEINRYSNIIFGASLSEELLGYLESDNPIEFAIRAILKFRPMTRIPVDEELDNCKKALMGYLVAA